MVGESLLLSEILVGETESSTLMDGVECAESAEESIISTLKVPSERCREVTKNGGVWPGCANSIRRSHRECPFSAIRL